MSDDGDRTCPVCAEEMDLTDQHLKPCKCGYEICVWCWHHIIEMAEKDGLEGRCPACRTAYDKQRIVAANCERMVFEIGAEKKQKSQKTKNKTSSTEYRKNLSSVRVVQRNLAYIMGLPNCLADENILERKEYFGQYGKVLKVSVSRPAGATTQQTSNNNTFNVYITYAREEEAIRCIQVIHNFALEDYPLRAFFGTTKYCHAWLKNSTCSNPDCLYLHEIGSQEESFAKDEIISTYTRSRVPQLPPRAGNMLPPPVDDLSNNGAVSTKHSAKNLVNVKIPTDSSCSRSTALPAAASWGLRVSPPASSNGCSQNPSKLKAEVLNTSSSSSIMTSKIPNGKPRVLNPLKHGEQKDSLAIASDVSSQPVLDAGHTSSSAWDDDVTVTNILGGKDTLHINGQSKRIETSKSGNSSSELVLDDAHHSAWDDDSVTISNANIDDRFRSSDTLESGTGFSQTPALDFKAKGLADSNRNSTVSISCSSSQISQQPESSNGRIPVSIVKSDLVNITNSKGADDFSHLSSAANGNTESLCLGLSSFNLDSDLGVGHVNMGQNHRWLDGNLGNLNLRLPPSVPISSGMESYPLNISNHIVNKSQNGDIVDEQFPLTENSRLSRVEMNTENESFFLTGHKEEMPSCFAKTQSYLGNASNIQKTVNANMEEKSIVSDIFSSDFDPWDDAWSTANNFAKLLGQMNKQEGPSKLSSSWDSQNTNQSRFSFARQENHANLEDGYLRDTSHAQSSFSLKQEPYGNCFGNNFSVNSFEGVNSLGASILSDGVSRAKTSAPPGFSAPNRAPPGFTSQDRYDLAFNTCSETQLLGNSLQNQFQDHSTGDVEFIDPAILAVGKGRLPLGANNTVLGSRSLHPQFPSMENDHRIQLLMQQSMSSTQDTRIPNHMGDRFLQFDDAYTSRFPSQNSSSLSPFGQISHQQHPSHFVNSSQWDGWNDMAISNGIGGVADVLRNQRFGLGSYFNVNEEPKFHLSSSGDLYNRAFGM